MSTPILEVLVIGREHTWHECSCGDSVCMFCGGGLSCCTVCRGFEGTLTTECVGRPLTEAEEKAIYNDGVLNFRKGRWLKEPNYPRCAKVE